MCAYAQSFLWSESINRVTKAGTQNGSNAWINIAQVTPLVIYAPVLW